MSTDLFPTDTVTINPVSGTVATTRATNPVCGPGELLTGFTARTASSTPYDTVNTINNFQCTNYLTGEQRIIPSLWAGATDSGPIKQLYCPAGSYISAIGSNYRGYGSNDRVISSIGITCKDINGAQKYSDKAGNENVTWTQCPSGYYLNGLDTTSGTVLNTVVGHCLDMNPRKNVLGGTPTTLACCTGAGNPLICGEYTPQSGYCDKFMTSFCQVNPNDPHCTCFNVPAGVPPCYAAKCLNTGYLTNNMKTTCPTQYVSCDAQIAAANSGTQLAGNYTLQQNCGQSGAQGTSTGNISTGGSGQTTTTSTPPTFTPAMMILLVFVLFIAFVVIYTRTMYPNFSFKSLLGR